MLVGRINFRLSLISKKAVALIYTVQAAINIIANRRMIANNEAYLIAVLWRSWHTKFLATSSTHTVLHPIVAFTGIHERKVMASA